MMASKVTLGEELLFPSLYLSAADCDGKDLTLTIKGISKQELRLQRGGTKTKPVISFVDHTKSLVLNKTNADSIAYLHGNRAEDWSGKPVTFYATQVPFGRDVVDAIRVRESVKKPSPPAAPPGKKATTINKTQAKSLFELVTAAGFTADEFFAKHGINALREFPTDKLQAVTDELEKLVAAKSAILTPEATASWQKYARGAKIESINSMGIPELRELGEVERAEVKALLDAELDIRGFTWDGGQYVPKAASPTASS